MAISDQRPCPTDNARMIVFVPTVTLEMYATSIHGDVGAACARVPSLDPPKKKRRQTGCNTRLHHAEAYGMQALHAVLTRDSQSAT